MRSFLLRSSLKLSTRGQEPEPRQSTRASQHWPGRFPRALRAERWESDIEAFSWPRDQTDGSRKRLIQIHVSDLLRTVNSVLRCGVLQSCMPWERTHFLHSPDCTAGLARRQYCGAPVIPQRFPYLLRRPGCRDLFMPPVCVGRICPSATCASCLLWLRSSSDASERRESASAPEAH